MADQPIPTELYYRFACSSLLVSGTRETAKDWDTGEETVTPTADVSLFVEADARRPMVRLPRMDGTHDLSIRLTSDGRLASVSGTTHGLLADAIAASLSAASFAAGLVGAAIAPRLPALPTVASTPKPPPPMPHILAEREEGVGEGRPAEPKPETPRELWEEQDPDGDATRLEKARVALHKLHTALIERSLEAGESQQPAAAYRRLIATKSAIGAVEEEISEINTRREAWYNAHFKTLEDRRFYLATDEAFHLAGDHSMPPQTIKASELKDGSRATKVALEELYVAVVEVRTSEAEEGATVDDIDDLVNIEEDEHRGDREPGVYFRVPRRAVIALYQDAADRDPNSSSYGERELTLHSFDQYWVVDRDSRMGSFPLRENGDLKASATFTDSGALDTASLDIESKMEKILEAIKGAPATIAGGVGEAKTAVENWSSLRAARADRELKALEQHKQQLELEVARRGLTADAAQTETLEQLKDRLDRLKTEKDIGAIQSPAEPSAEEQETEERQKLAAQLRTEVAIARAEHELAAFHDDGGSTNGHGR